MHLLGFYLSDNMIHLWKGILHTSRAIVFRWTVCGFGIWGTWFLSLFSEKREIQTLKMPLTHTHKLETWNRFYLFIYLGDCLTIVIIQSLSCIWLFATPWTAAHQASLSFTISRSLLQLMSVESMMSSNHFILCYFLLLLPSIFPSIRVFSNESALRIRWPMYWRFSFNISPSNEYSGLISFRTYWFDLAVQGALKSLLQHHSSNFKSQMKKRMDDKSGNLKEFTSV